MWVLDASVAVKWFFLGEDHRDAAVLALNALTDRPDGFVVPDFFYYELAAVLTRRSKHDKTMIAESLSSLYQMGIPSVPLGEQQAHMAVALACEHKISFYDAVYASLARLMNGVWLTADKKALDRLPRKIVRHVSEFRASVS